MEIRYLYEFVTVAEKLSFSAAADALFMSQATLSKHVAAMEEELGCKLFDRSTHQVVLTENGRTLLATAEAMAKEYQHCIDELDRHKSMRQKTIRIASIPVIEPYHISDMVLAFQREHPNIEMQVREMEETDIASAFQSGECDLGFQRLLKGEIKNYFTVPYYNDEIVVIVPKDHKLASYKTIPLSMLREEPFIVMDEKTALYEVMMNACQQSGYDPKIFYKGHRPENILGLVAKGMGVSLLPRREVEFYVNPGVSIIQLAQPVMSTVYLTRPKQLDMEYPYHVFVEYVKNLEQIKETSR